MCEGLRRQASSLRDGDFALPQHLKYGGVVRRIAQDHDRLEVLRGCTQQGHPPDVDLLDRLRPR